MCENYKPCASSFYKKPRRLLTTLLLDCWQREYDKRPYRNFRFSLIDFEGRMQRKFHSVYDFAIIVAFLQKRVMCTVRITGIDLSPDEHEILYSFVDSLLKVRRIELRLMNLPSRFFDLLGDRVEIMKVKELILEGTILTALDIEALYFLIMKSEILRHLNVSNCNVSQYDFPLLADGVLKSVSMRSFICNRIVGKGITLDTTKVAHIVSSLICQNKLEELEMEKCEFQGRDMEIISEYMAPAARTIHKLNFSFNCIGPDGAEHIFRAIVSSNTVTHLNIGGNHLGSIGGRIVANYLSSCHLLVYLNITWNNICPDVMNLILTSIKKPVKLYRMEIFGNRFDTKSANILRRLIDAEVLLQKGVDVISVYDESLGDFRVTRYD
ncbi:protein CARMIL [Eurosta solidaginis]|uniref:protein CARMIL n=1 Tax=Eurosta solidaginis TaxID=178769 RepID=UPI00353081F7